jgi:hypothetical protein
MPRSRPVAGPAGYAVEGAPLRADKPNLIQWIGLHVSHSLFWYGLQSHMLLAQQPCMVAGVTHEHRLNTMKLATHLSGAI